MLDAKLLDLLVCPVSKGPRVYRAERHELWCRQSGLAYPVRDAVPIMLEREAHQLSLDEIKTLE